MSNCRISWSLEAAKFGFWLFQSLWNLTGTSAAALPRCLSNIRALRSLHTIITRSLHDHYTLSHSFETSRDLAVRSLTTQWIEALIRLLSSLVRARIQDLWDSGLYILCIPQWQSGLRGEPLWCIGIILCAPSQWETTLHCNVVSHWLGTYTKWSLCTSRTLITNSQLSSWPLCCQWWHQSLSFWRPPLPSVTTKFGIIKTHGFQCSDLHISLWQFTLYRKDDLVSLSKMKQAITILKR